MTNPCASRSVAVQNVRVKVTNCGRYVASGASSRPARTLGGPIAASSASNRSNSISIRKSRVDAVFRPTDEYFQTWLSRGGSERDQYHDSNLRLARSLCADLSLACLPIGVRAGEHGNRDNHHREVDSSGFDKPLVLLIVSLF
jgi:hypothetical protein